MVRRMWGHARLLWAGCVVAALIATSASGRAQSSGNDSAAAQVLFDEARTLAKDGDFDAACPKFAASHELDPQLGTLLNLADCYSRGGKLASSWARFLEAAELAKQKGDGREDEARKRADELEPRLAKIRIVVSNPVEGLSVKRGDIAVTEPQWGTALPADAGQHRIVATAPGHEPWETTLSVEDEGGSTDVTVPELKPASAKPDGDGPTPTTTEPYDPTPQLVAGAVVGVVGLAGIGVGTAFAVIARNKDAESLAFCDPVDPTACFSEEGPALRDEARQSQTIAIVSFVAGGVLTLTGVLLIVTAVLMGSGESEGAPDVSVAPTLSHDGAGCMVQGRF